MAKAPAKSAKTTSRKPGANHPFGRRPLVFFGVAIVLPLLLLYGLGALLMVMLLSMMATDIDRLDDAHDVSAMRSATDAFLRALADSVSDEGTWDEAYLNVVVRPDPAWMDGTWGTTARLGQTYDTVLVTDQNGEIIFGEDAVGTITGNVGQLFSTAHIMLNNLDLGIAATGDAKTVSEFATDGSTTLAVAAISIHQTSETGAPKVAREARRILWVQKHLDSAVLDDISARYQLPKAKIGVAHDDSLLSLHLTDSENNVAGTLVWQPLRTGEAAFRRALLVAGLAYSGIGLCLVAGLVFVGRFTLRWRATAPAAGAGLPQAGFPAGPEAADRLAGLSAANFTIDYQPVFDLRAEKLVGAEALLRWTGPDGNMLRQESLSSATTAGLLEQVGLLALRQAAGELALLADLILTVTITPQQLQSPVFAEKLAATMSSVRFAPRRLRLAVSASLLPAGDGLRDAIARFRQQGVAITLSDFVLAPATSSYLQSGFADRIQLSRDTVMGIDSDPGRLALVEATISVARAAALEVSVSGLERKQDAGRLLRIGCREFQGTLLAPPMSAAGLTALLMAPAAKKAS